MPHLSFEYSSGITGKADLTGFARCLRDAMQETGVFPLGGIRVRGHACDINVVADQSADFEFIHMSCKVGAGRNETTRRAAAEAIYAAAERWVTANLGTTLLALSFTLDELDPVTSIKRYNTVHDHFKKE